MYRLRGPLSTTAPLTPLVMLSKKRMFRNVTRLGWALLSHLQTLLALMCGSEPSRGREALTGDPGVAQSINRVGTVFICIRNKLIDQMLNMNMNV